MRDRAMRRSLMALTALLLVAVVVAGCGAGAEPTPVPPAAPPAAAPATEAPAAEAPAAEASPTTMEEATPEEAAAPEETPAAEAEGTPAAAEAPAAGVSGEILIGEPTPATIEAAELPEGAPFTIGISNGFVGSEWRTQMISDLELINAEYMEAGLTTELVIENADVDVQGQIQQIRNLMNRGVHAIIVNPNSQTALNPVIQEAVDAGIIVIAVDQEISAPGAINVVIDQTEWARISARWLVDQLGGEGGVVVINGIAGHPANEARWQGVQEVFGENPGIEVLNVVNANWDQATGQQQMSQLLAALPSIDGVWVQDGMAQGALQALSVASPAEWPVMVGEARAGYIQLWNDIKQERPEFTSFGVVNPPGVGGSGLRVAVELLSGRELAEGALQGPFSNSLYVPIPGVVDEDNFDEIYAAVADLPGSYVLDGIISREEAQQFFQEQ